MARGWGRGRSGGRNHLVLMVLVLATIGVLAAAGSGLESGDDTSGAPAGLGGPSRAGRTLTVAFASPPRSLDPAFATDRTSATLVLALMEPLVRLGRKLEVEPALARSWEISEDGRRIRFTLRTDRIWTNGEPVTAGDVEFAWKRLLSASTGSPLAGPLLAVEGAPAYHACTFACGRLEDALGIRAVDDRTLVVTLARREPWFLRSAGLPQLVPLQRDAVLRGRTWTAPGRIVTNGPFVLGGLNDRGVSLVRNARFAGPGAARPARVEGRFIPDPAARVQAFDAGVVQALDGSPLPKTDLVALEERREFQRYPTLEIHLYGFNFTTVTDVHQRRAMALAVDRESLVENASGGGEEPAERFTPQGVPRQGRAARNSPWLPPGGDLDAARAELEEAAVVNRQLTLLHPDRPGAGDVAAFLRDAWRRLGIDVTVRSRPASGYLDFKGPLGRASADLYEVVLDGTIPDAWPSLAAWLCRSPVNKTNFCNGRYERLVREARREADPVARNDSMVHAQDILAGPEGVMPAMPVLWPVFTNLESLAVRDSFWINPLGQIDLAAASPG